jgi:type IV secretory pathway component VirB8
MQKQACMPNWLQSMQRWQAVVAKPLPHRAVLKSLVVALAHLAVLKSLVLALVLPAVPKSRPAILVQLQLATAAVA